MDESGWAPVEIQARNEGDFMVKGLGIGAVETGGLEKPKLGYGISQDNLEKEYIG